MKVTQAWVVLRDVLTMVLGVVIALNEEFHVKEPREAMLYFAGALLAAPPVRSGIELILGRGTRALEESTASQSSSSEHSV